MKIWGCRNRVLGSIVVDSTSNSQSKTKKMRFGCFYFTFTIIGLLLAFWFGFGWFILLQTIRQIMFTITPLYILVLMKFVDPEYANSKKLSLGSSWFTSYTSVVTLVFLILLTVLFFWKINISVVDIIGLMR